MTFPVGIAKPGVKSFSKIPLTLVNPPIIIEEYFDFIDVDILNTTADTSKVYIYIDNESLPFRLSDIAGTFVIGKKVTITWDSSQNGLNLVLVLGKEYRYFTYRGWFTLGRETIGLMSTLNGIKTTTDKLVFDTASNVKVDLANAEIILPIEKQSNYKSYFTIYSGTVTASGNTSDIYAGIYSGLEIMLKVTAVSGTSPTLDLYIEGKFEATGDYKPLVYLTGIDGTGIWYFTITQLMFRYIRARWVLGGTSPSFTIGVHAQGLV
jgi:hypothetical protein